MKNLTTAPWTVTKTSHCHTFTPSYWNVVMMSHGDVMMTSHQFVSMTSQISLKWVSSLKHPATLSGTSPRMECIHNVPLVRLCNISSNFQMKHPITWPWYVFTTSQNYIVATPSLYYVLYYVFKLLGHEIHLLDFHISSKYQIKHQIFLLQIRRKTRGVVWIIN